MRIFYCVNIYASTDICKKVDTPVDSMDTDELQNSSDLFAIDPSSSAKQDKVSYPLESNRFVS